MKFGRCKLRFMIIDAFDAREEKNYTDFSKIFAQKKGLVDW